MWSVCQTRGRPSADWLQPKKVGVPNEHEGKGGVGPIFKYLNMNNFCVFKTSCISRNVGIERLLKLLIPF